VRNESKLRKEILEEIKETNRLIREMNQSFVLLMKKMAPEKHGSETIKKGGSIAEITVRTPEKLEEWRNLFESRGMRVEYYEPFRRDGEEYFAKIWGHLEKSNSLKDKKQKVPELKRNAFLVRENMS
jgi:aspartate/tyrosine/aromatic aminotransferase